MADTLRARLARLDWPALAAALDADGHAVTPPLLTAAECEALAGLWPHDRRFRQTIDMGRYRFGEGTYRYFAAPLPPVVATLRAAAYDRLAPIATRWAARLGWDATYPPRLAAFLAQCARAGQTRPTPLLLAYGARGFNRLHQDRYGPVAFPLQVTVMLDRPGVDFTGGEFLLVEQWPRAQSVGRAIVLARGQAVIFPNAVRPVAGARGDFRVAVRHGVSTVHRGTRRTLGIIFHDAA